MAFLYKNFVFSELTMALGDDATDLTVEVSADKDEDFRELIADDNQAVLVIKEEVAGSPVKVEVVKLTAVNGRELTIERAQEGTTRQAFTTAARISNTVTAERAAILGGVANIDLEPDGERKVGTSEKPFMEVHAKNVNVKHGSHEFVIKPGPAAIAANQDLLLPPGGGTLMRTEDTTEEHPGCFLGELCVEPDTMVRTLSARDTEYGHGIHIVSHDSTDRTVKVAMHNSAGSDATLVSVLGLELDTGGDMDDPTYRKTGITVGGETHDFTDVRIETVGDFYTAEGTRSTSFTLELFEEWLGTLSFDRRADSVLVSKHVFADKLSVPDLTATRVTIGDNRVMRIPVLEESPGVDQDETENYAVGSVVYATSTMVPYVCIDATEGAAKWRPMVMPDPSNLSLLFSGGVVGGTTSAVSVPVGSNATGYNLSQDAWDQDWPSYKRFYASLNYSGYAISGIFPAVPLANNNGVSQDLLNIVMDGADFIAGGNFRLNGFSVRYVPDGSTLISDPAWQADALVIGRLRSGGGNEARGIFLWGEE